MAESASRHFGAGREFLRWIRHIRPTASPAFIWQSAVGVPASSASRALVVGPGVAGSATEAPERTRGTDRGKAARSRNALRLNTIAHGAPPALRRMAKMEPRWPAGPSASCGSAARDRPTNGCSVGGSAAIVAPATGTKIENRGNILVRVVGTRGGVPTVITKRNPKNGKDTYLCQSMGTVTGTSTAAFMVMALDDGNKRSGHVIRCSWPTSMEEIHCLHPCVTLWHLCGDLDATLRVVQVRMFRLCRQTPYLPPTSQGVITGARLVQCLPWTSSSSSRMEIPPSGVLVKVTEWDFYLSLLLRHRRAVRTYRCYAHTWTVPCPCWQDYHYSELVPLRPSQSCHIQHQSCWLVLGTSGKAVWRDPDQSLGC